MSAKKVHRGISTASGETCTDEFCCPPRPLSPTPMTQELKPGLSPEDLKLIAGVSHSLADQIEESGFFYGTLAGKTFSAIISAARADTRPIPEPQAEVRGLVEALERIKAMTAGSIAATFVGVNSLAAQALASSNSHQGEK